VVGPCGRSAALRRPSGTSPWRGRSARSLESVRGHLTHGPLRRWRPQQPAPDRRAPIVDPDDWSKVLLAAIPVVGAVAKLLRGAVPGRRGRLVSDADLLAKLPETAPRTSVCWDTWTRRSRASSRRRTGSGVTSSGSCSAWRSWPGPQPSPSRRSTATGTSRRSCGRPRRWSRCSARSAWCRTRCRGHGTTRVARSSRTGPSAAKPCTLIARRYAGPR
jgi:hypothetical protein